MKIKSVEFSNRNKRVRVLYSSGKSVQFHYSQVGFRKKISQALVDVETGRKSLVFEFPLFQVPLQ